MPINRSRALKAALTAAGVAFAVAAARPLPDDPAAPLYVHASISAIVFEGAAHPRITTKESRCLRSMSSVPVLRHRELSHNPSPREREDIWVAKGNPYLEAYRGQRENSRSGTPR